MMAITTINSIRAKAVFCLRMFFISGASFYFCFGRRKRQTHSLDPMDFMVCPEVIGFQTPDKTVAVELWKAPPSTGEGQSSAGL